MGLDMFLTARRNFADFGSDENKKKNERIRSFFPNPTRSRTVTLEDEIGYWRKANMIHKWFVDEIQNGKDNCQKYWVDRRKLENDLLERCLRILRKSRMVPGNVQNCMRASAESGGKFVPVYQPGKIIEDPTVAMETLPIQKGFFFGSDHYDENYIYDIESTVVIINTSLSAEYAKWDLYYHSSW